MNEWAIALIAALLGGLLSGFGAWLAVGRQMKAQTRGLDEMASEFLKFYIGEQREKIDTVLKYRGSQTGQHDLFSLSLILSNYSLFERNRETLIRIKDKQLRSDILHHVLGVQTWAEAMTGNINFIQRTVSDASHFAAPPTEQSARVEQVSESLEKLYSSAPKIVDDLKKIEASLDKGN